MSGGGWRVFRGRRVVLEDGVQEAAVLVSPEGRIAKVLRAADWTADQLPPGAEVVDAGDLVLMPGLVDSHVHVNEPGRTSWEGFHSATRAAARGGVTTVVDMPLNSIPPTTTKENLQEKMDAAEGQLYVDVAFWGGVVPGNQDQLRELVSCGVVGFKCFLCPSGVPEFPAADWECVEEALAELKGTSSVLAFHAECELAVNGDGDSEHGLPTEYQTYLRSRPPEMEVEAIQRIIALCEKYRVRCHIVHLSAADALPVLRRARTSGLPLTVETCHHYLTLTAEAVPDRATQFKCCPPIRELQNRERLWAGVASGELDLVVSDHSPSTPDLKHFDDGNFLLAWGGIASVQFGLSLFWTQARKRCFSLLNVAQLLCKAPAKLCGLQDCKGKIAEGMDADFVIWDPDASYVVKESIIEFKNKTTPYLGMQLDGLVKMTVVRGRTVYHHGLPFKKPEGKTLLKSKILK